jgi:protein-L-isoaspartate(D-aspartate) O-methyltransferase
MTEFERQRAHMVDVHLARRGVRDRGVLEAFRGVAREQFLPEELAPFAYDDGPLPIGEGQTISQPYIVAFTAEALALRGDERVLEVGTASGYAAAILSCLAKDVYTIERIESLAETARERLARLGYANVHVVCGDGSVGLPDHAPYDAIAVAAGGPRVPRALLAQLAVGGRLVIPIGPDASNQELVRITRESESHFREELLADVTFVPLIGAEGWSPDFQSGEAASAVSQADRPSGGRLVCAAHEADRRSAPNEVADPSRLLWPTRRAFPDTDPFGLLELERRLLSVS